jgi:AcrR family transcriptional regulator
MPMPRPVDPRVTEKILEAARRIWARGGDSALTMRAVAAAARTTTPTVYARFEDRGALLAALRARAATALADWMRPTRSFAEGGRRYLEFAADHPHEYNLLFGPGWSARTPVRAASQAMMPLAVLRQALAGTLGGIADEHLDLATRLLLVLHGAASLLLDGHGAASQPRSLPDLRAACIAACETLVEAERARRVPTKPGRRARSRRPDGR